MKLIDLLLSAPMWLIWTCLGCSLVSGMSLRYLSHARGFSRRNALGVEQFTSYGNMLGARFVDSLVGVVGALLLAGSLALMMLAAYRILIGA